MKKIIVLLLTLSLLICTNAIVYATEGDDGGSEPIATVGDTSETAVESYTKEEADPTDDTNEADKSVPTEESAETETTDPAEKSVEAETDVPTEESETPETTEPKDESVVPEGYVSTCSSETSEEPVGKKAEGNMQPASNEEPVPNGEILNDVPSPVNEVYNIKIEWKGMVFTYHEATIGTWDPDNEGGPAWVNPQPAHWTSSDPTNNDCGTLTITNKVESVESVKVSVKFTPDTKWGAYKVGLAISEDESKVTTDNPDDADLYWAATKTFNKAVPKGQMETVYVRPGVSTDTLSNNTFKEASDTPVLFGNITVSVNPDFNDPKYPEQPEIFD